MSESWRKQEMRRGINTIPGNEYYELLSEEARRMRRKISRLMQEENSMRMACEDKEEYEEAEMHDFNERVLFIAMQAITKSPNQFRQEYDNHRLQGMER